SLGLAGARLASIHSMNPHWESLGVAQRD
ncbi:hypothetical protein A2U01_0080916, partial [Trifolium medium]|nr:hypothetical protein [Trifolium medium]